MEEPDPVVTLKKRNESSHDYNYFLDREIQEKLLDFVDLENDREQIGSASFIVQNFDLLVSNHGSNTQNSFWNSKKKTNADDFGGWAGWELPIRSQRTSEKTTRSTNKPRDFQFYKDWKAKDIQYTFHHFQEFKQYMEQYRNQHTYKSGAIGKHAVPVNGTMAPDGLTADQAVLSRLQQYPVRYNRSRTPPEVSRSHRSAFNPDKKSQSEANILELQHRYRFDPEVVRAVGSPDVNPHLPDDLPGSRSSSAKSTREKTIVRSRSTISLTPLRTNTPPKTLLHGKLPSTMGITGSPTGNPGANHPFFQGKSIKAGNGYSSESQ